MITIAWTPAALTQFHNLGLTPAGVTFVQNHTQNWILGNAAGWPLNVNQAFFDPQTGRTVTARVVAIAGNNRNVNVVAVV